MAQKKTTMGGATTTYAPTKSAARKPKGKVKIRGKLKGGGGLAEMAKYMTQGAGNRPKTTSKKPPIAQRVRGLATGTPGSSPFGANRGTALKKPPTKRKRPTYKSNFDKNISRGKY